MTLRGLPQSFTLLVALACPGAAQGEGFDILQHSLGETAAQVLPPLFDQTVQALAAFNEDTLPHEAKDLRKKVVKLRDHFDLLAAAYPVSSDSRDLWKDLRRDLDEGYEKIGLFKDLFDSQGLEIAVWNPELNQWSDGIKPADIEYDRSEVKSRRKAVSKWLKKFLGSSRQQLYRSYVIQPDLVAIHLRPSEVESRFYWGGANLAPDERLSGGANLSALIAALCRIAIENQSDLDVVDDLTNPQHEVVFHDYRKQVRSIVKVVSYFPVLVASSSETDNSLETLSTLVTKFGEIEDLIVAYHLAQDDDEDEEAAKIAKKIAKKWAQLRVWQTEVDVNAALSYLGNSVTH